MSRFPATYHDLPDGPPPEVLAQIDVAWERARELYASGMELHFEVDAKTGTVHAELCGADGTQVERLSAQDALALACGDPAGELALAA